jgi:hypothetical protein
LRPRSLGSVWRGRAESANAVHIVEREGGPEMFKRLFYAVLGFWLLKKYVLPHFSGGSDKTADTEL